MNTRTLIFALLSFLCISNFVWIILEIIHTNFNPGRASEIYCTSEIISTDELLND